MRLRADFFVSALIRRCNGAMVDAVLRRRGAAEAGAVFVKVDRLDGTADLYGPAPQSLVPAMDGSERLFAPILRGVSPAEVEERMAREIRFDPDLWLVEIESRSGVHFLDLADDS